MALRTELLADAGKTLAKAVEARKTEQWKSGMVVALRKSDRRSVRLDCGAASDGQPECATGAHQSGKATRLTCFALTPFRVADLVAPAADSPTVGPSRPSNSHEGVICRLRVEEIQGRTMRETRCLDKIVDELATGKAMDKIPRS